MRTSASGSDRPAVYHLRFRRSLAAGTLTAQLDTNTHAPGRLTVDDDDRHPCLYDHLQRLLSALQALGHQAAIEVADSDRRVWMRAQPSIRRSPTRALKTRAWSGAPSEPISRA